ncbi:MAG: cytochrome c biogenesis protein CcsA [Gemmataceae bacterium]|nr:cytochrome c biogenesis protein CcsA [Gemmataceae bacterium]
MRTLATWLPVMLTASFFAYLAIPARDSDEDFHLHRFSRLPVVHSGRPMPIDSLARTALMTLNGGRQTYKQLVEKTIEEKKREAAGERVDETFVTKSAVKWFADSLISGGGKGPAVDQRVFYITDLDLLNRLGFRVEDRRGFRYAYAEIEPKLDLLREEAERIRNLEPKTRTPLDNHVMELASKLEVFLRISHFDDPHYLFPLAAGQEWKKLAQGAQEHRDGGREHPVLAAFKKLIIAYEGGDQRAFNAAVAEYEQAAETHIPSDRFKAYVETMFNKVSPFFWTQFLYWGAFLLACASWLGWFRELRSASLLLCVLLFAVHTIALGARMWLQGRPPVTNLYSSAIFIGWTSILTALIMETIYRNSISIAFGSVVAAVSLTIAYYLGIGEDTMAMLQAVLDTNFWLATHVTTITFGYSATFLAGAAAAAYIILGVFTPALRGENGVMLSKMIYGILCFATLLSFVGTVLGGIWADYSWGRFWGWDPKENGALMIVIWNALILHARWGGMAKARGIAVLALFGNCITAWSWFGTNLLGIGLHAYGFMAGAFYGVLGFCALNLVVMVIGLIPQSNWASFRREYPTRLPEPSEPLTPAGAA